jgi:hypothetical protein
VRFRALGGSMFPAIRSGDVLSIRHCSPDGVEPGDVVLMLDDDRVFVHRLMAKHLQPDRPGLVTRGDAHWRNDPARPPTALLGKVVMLTRKGHPRNIRSRLPLFQRIGGLVVSELTRAAGRALCHVPRLTAERSIPPR